MVLKYKVDGNQVSLSYDEVSELEHLPSKTDWDRLDALTEEQIVFSSIIDEDQPPMTTAELNEFLDRLRQLNNAKYGQGGQWGDPNKRTASK